MSAVKSETMTMRIDAGSRLWRMVKPAPAMKTSNSGASSACFWLQTVPVRPRHQRPSVGFHLLCLSLSRSPSLPLSGLTVGRLCVNAPVVAEITSSLAPTADAVSSSSVQTHLPALGWFTLFSVPDGHIRTVRKKKSKHQNASCLNQNVRILN